MASLLLTAGVKGQRKCLPHARIMLHQPLGAAEVGRAREPGPHFLCSSCLPVPRSKAFVSCSPGMPFGLMMPRYLVLAFHGITCRPMKQLLATPLTLFATRRLPCIPFLPGPSVGHHDQGAGNRVVCAGAGGKAEHKGRGPGVEGTGYGSRVRGA